MIRKLASASLSIVLITLLGTTVIAQKTAPAATAASKLLELKVPAPSLKANLLGEPLEQPTYVYLPPSYATDTTRRYPTLYLLHGFLSTSKVWISGSYQGFNLQTSMDELIGAGKVREMIVVAANGYDAYGGSFYTNSPVSGNWDDFVTRDLVNYVDANYHTIARAESRGIAGHSMGGFGAVVLAMRHPDVFSALFALSPCCLAMESDMSQANTAWPKILTLTSRDQLNVPPKNFNEFYNDVFVALAAAFSPNPAHPPFLVDFPFEAIAGPCSPPASQEILTAAPCVQMVGTIYSKWRANIPSYVAEANKENLRKLRGIFLDYGEKENFMHIRTGVQLFSKTLTDLNIPHQFEVYAEGDHGSRVRVRMETRVFQFFNEKLVFEK